MAYPSGAGLAIDHLTEIIPDAHIGDSPPQEGTRFVVINRIGGGEDTPRTDENDLDIHVYETTPARLHELTEQVRDGVKGMRARYKAAPRVTKAKITSGPMELDDPDRHSLKRNVLQAAITLKDLRSPAP